MDTNVLQIILEILLVALGFYLAFFKSYFQEKGKNLATKEDVDEITTKVEGIKNEFLFATQAKLSLRTEERNALVNSYERYNFWLNTILDSYFGGINEENKSKIQDMEDRINDAKFQYEIAEGRMELFVNNADLSKLKGELKIKTLELQHDFQNYCGQVELVLHEISSMRLSTPIDKQFAEYKKLLEKKSSLLGEYNVSKLVKFKTISEMDAQVKLLIYDHLTTLIEN